MITTVAAIIPYNGIGKAFLKEIFRTGFVFSDVIHISPRAYKHMETEIHNNHFSAKGSAKF
jgi:hypothetical protein